MTEKETDEMKDRISKLEKKGSMNLWLQFLIFPLILAGMGYYFQNVVQQSERRMEQLKMTQEIVSTVFNDTIYEKTVAMRGLLDEILENDDLSMKIGELIDKRLKDIVLNGTVQEMESVTNAVEKFSSNNDSLKLKFKSSSEIQSKITKHKRAVNKEREAFTYLLNNELANAGQAFKQTDEIYPTYHQAYEIYRYLYKNKAYYNDADQIKKIKKYIVTNYNWGAPPDLLKKLSLQAE